MKKRDKQRVRAAVVCRAIPHRANSSIYLPGYLVHRRESNKFIGEVWKQKKRKWIAVGNAISPPFHLGVFPSRAAACFRLLALEARNAT